MNELVTLDEAAAQALAEETMAMYGEAENKWRAMQGRQQALRSLVMGRWGEVFSEDFGTDEDLPMVANSFRKHTEDIGHLFAQSEPTERVPPDGNDEKPALKRERILVSYNARSRFADSLEYRGMDMAAGAYTVIRVWPEVGKRGDKRFPHFSRLDPLCVLPPVDWDPAAPTDDVFVHYGEPIAKLERQFPEAMARLRAKLSTEFVMTNFGYDISKAGDAARQLRNPLIRVVDFYSARYIMRFALCQSYGERHYEMLVCKPNDTEVCPVQIAYRPSWGDEPTGQMDDSKGIVRAKHRSWVMLMDYFVQMVYGGKLAWNVLNANEKGPNTTYRALSADAFMKPVTPEAPAFQALQVFGQMDQEERLAQVRPASREGEAPVNKASAAFLTRSQGELTDVVRSFYSEFASAKQNANEAAFAQDVRWCGGTKKKIYGIARGKRFAETYSPKDDIAGDYDSIVTYAPATGVDAPTQQVMNQNKLSLGAMARETFIEQDPTITEPAEEIARIQAQALEDGFIGKLATQGSLQASAEAVLALKQGRPIEEIIERAMIQERQAAQAALPSTAPGGQPSPPGAPNPAAATGVAGAEGANVPLPSPELIRAR